MGSKKQLQREMHRSVKANGQVSLPHFPVSIACRGKRLLSATLSPEGGGWKQEGKSRKGRGSSAGVIWGKGVEGKTKREVLLVSHWGVTLSRARADLPGPLCFLNSQKKILVRKQPVPSRNQDMIGDNPRGSLGSH